MKLKNGTPVIIKHSHHSAVSTGDEGKIDGFVEGHYGVEITKYFPHAQANIKPQFETRVIYFKRHQLKEKL